MKTLLKWAGRTLVAVLVLILLSAGFVFLRSSTLLTERHRKPVVHRLVVTGSPEQLARGRHLADVAGCRDCHGADLTGRLFHDEPNIARIWAPNLTLVARDWSAEDIDRALRHGVRPDGKGLWVMPSSAFAQLEDADAAALIAYLKAQPARGPERPRTAVGPVGRLGVVLGKFRGAVTTLKETRRRALDLGPAHAAGRYRAEIACAECHGADLAGGVAMKAPDLAIAASYDLPAFTRLMRTGLAADGKPRGLMSAVARARFAHFSDAEIAELHAYLTARAEKQP
jgi:cytochrome c553